MVRNDPQRSFRMGMTFGVCQTCRDRLRKSRRHEDCQDGDVPEQEICNHAPLGRSFIDKKSSQLVLAFQSCHQCQTLWTTGDFVQPNCTRMACQKLESKVSWWQLLHDRDGTSGLPCSRGRPGNRESRVDDRDPAAMNFSAESV